jgi:hypothetical protein
MKEKFEYRGKSITYWKNNGLLESKPNMVTFPLIRVSDFEVVNGHLRPYE